MNLLNLRKLSAVLSGFNSRGKNDTFGTEKAQVSSVGIKAFIPLLFLVSTIAHAESLEQYVVGSWSTPLDNPDVFFEIKSNKTFSMKWSKYSSPGPSFGSYVIKNGSIILTIKRGKIEDTDGSTTEYFPVGKTFTCVRWLVPQMPDLKQLSCQHKNYRRFFDGQTVTNNYGAFGLTKR